ncbi:MAG: putative toxin-antitoxin system toxin component, PIN family [Clostridiales bacterium]|nr:putative toxin-antitoxin system toxin component, PIN family [Clostridiales bacterium]
MKIYAVIDTNVLVSAMLKWSSVPGTIIEFAFRGIIIPVLNDKIVKEYRSVLLRERFHLTSDIVDDVIRALEEQGEFIDPEHINITLPDPDDAIFYEVVMEKRKTNDSFLVTGNIKHFPNQPFIVTPRELLEIIIEQQ